MTELDAPQRTMPRVPTSTVGKTLSALAYAARRPARAWSQASRALAELMRERVRVESPIPEASLRDLLFGAAPAVDLVDFEGRTGNVTLEELVVIATLVRARRPRRLLEIGTFDGNTTLQMARNAPDDARVFTLDLPPDHGATAEPLHRDELRYVHDTGKQTSRRYQTVPSAGCKVEQLLGDSATFDLAALAARHGAFDFVFVDGSHTAEYVRNDTAKVLPLLAPHACVLWHDYKPAWPGVVAELDARAADLGLRRVAGTSLVCMLGRTA